MYIIYSQYYFLSVQCSRISLCIQINLLYGCCNKGVCGRTLCSFLSLIFMVLVQELSTVRELKQLPYNFKSCLSHTFWCPLYAIIFTLSHCERQSGISKTKPFKANTEHASFQTSAAMYMRSEVVKPGMYYTFLICRNNSVNDLVCARNVVETLVMPCITA